MEYLQEMYRPFFNKTLGLRVKVLNYSLSVIGIIIKKIFSGKSKRVFSCCLFPFNLIGAAFTDYTLLLFFHLTEEKRGANVAPSATINGI